MGALGDDAAGLHDCYVIGVDHGGEPVGDGDDGVSGGVVGDGIVRCGKSLSLYA